MHDRDPIGAWLRGTRAQRRVGRAAACTCGEARPFALISGRSPPICFRCDRLAHGGDPYEDNHVFGKRNSELTIRYPINDHRAVFNVKQYRWPPGALENPNGSPLLDCVARMHGAYDNIEHMLAENREFAAKLAHLEEQLTIIYGPQWPAKLETAAARKRAAVAKCSPLGEQDGARLLKQSSAKHESSQRRKGRTL
jgi:hypothetical protein